MEIAAERGSAGSSSGVRALWLMMLFSIVGAAPLTLIAEAQSRRTLPKLTAVALRGSDQVDADRSEWIAILSKGLPRQFNLLTRLQSAIAIHLDLAEMRPAAAGGLVGIKHAPALIVEPFTTDRADHTTSLSVTEVLRRHHIRYGRQLRYGRGWISVPGMARRPTPGTFR